ncbi:unnamed protein product, partial [Prorocentrum cordatum]
ALVPRRPVGDMADVLTLDVGDPQILVRYENDAHGFFWDHGLLLFRVSEDIWICFTPDHDLVQVKLLDTRHEVLERRAPFPAHLANQVYTRDPIGGAALAAFWRRARLQGQLFGVGQVDAIERMIWVVAEPRSHRFGEIIDAALMGDEGRGTGFDQKGVAALDGEEFFVQKIAASGLADFKRGAQADLGDVRTLGDHRDAAGQRILRLSEAVALMRDVEQPNSPLAGVRSVKEFLDSVASGPGNLTSYQAEWERLSRRWRGLGGEVIRLMHSCDQVDASMSACAELLEQKQTRKGDGKGGSTLDPNPKRHHNENVARRFEAHGDCPTDLTEESPLAEILDARDHCGMEPKNLASFDFDKVKFLHRRVHVRPTRRELPPAALGYLRHASDLIESDQAELEKDRAEGEGFSPHWDPALRRSRDLRKRLYQRLSQQGLLTWRRRLKGRAGIFVVKKNPGGARGDVGDCFYNFTIPELASWFGFEDRFDTVELDGMGCRPATARGDAVGAESEVVDGEALCPCMAAVCMGWSWALCFASEAVTYRVEKTLADGPDQIMREMQPAPILKPGKCATGVHVDNVQVIGGCKSDRVKQMTDIENSCGKDNIPFDIESGGGEFEMQTLGVVHHWRGRRLRHVTRRVWRTYLVGHALLRRSKLHGHALQCWLGHVVNLNQLCPEATSALNACDRFIDEALEVPKRTRPSAVKLEIRCAMNLFFLVEADLGAKFPDQVYCGGSSTRGHVLHVTVGGPGEIRAAWKWRERRRCRDAPTVEGQVSEGLGCVQGGAPGSAAGPLTAFGQALRSRAEVRPRPRGRSAAGKVARAKVTLVSGIPALADGRTHRRRCRLVAADRWRWQDEHISLKEARVALMGPRRHCRSVRLLGSKLPTLSDSQVTVGALEKGRSSAGLQALRRRAAAYLLGGQIARWPRYIETDRHPSDFDSRQWGDERATGQPASARERRPRPEAPPDQAAAAVGPTGKTEAIDPRGRLPSVADTHFSLEGELTARTGRQRPPGKGRPRLPSAPRRVGPIKVPGRDSLVMATVTGATLERNAAAAHEFEVYAQAKKLDLQPLSRLDDSLAQYFVDMYDDGFGVWGGRGTLHGHWLLRLKTTGWAKRSPGRMRLPLPDIIVDDIALDSVGHDLPLMGAAVSLQTDTYTRPSEVVKLRQGQILPPAPAAKLGAHYGIVIAPSEWCEVTKTGGQDDSLPVGDAARPWLTNVLRIPHQPKATDS